MGLRIERIRGNYYSGRCRMDKPRTVPSDCKKLRHGHNCKHLSMQCQQRTFEVILTKPVNMADSKSALGARTNNMRMCCAQYNFRVSCTPGLETVVEHRDLYDTGARGHF